MRSRWIRVSPKSDDCCPYKRREIWTQTRTEGRHVKTQRHRQEGHMMTEAEIGVMRLQAKELQDHQQPPEEEETRKDPP